MKKIEFTLIILFCIIFTACRSVFYGNYNPSIAITGDDHIFLKNVSTQVNAYYFLGIGGNEHNELIKEAKEKLYAENSLQEDNYLANVIIDFKHSWYLLFFSEELTLTLTADVVNFNYYKGMPADSILKFYKVNRDDIKMRVDSANKMINKPPVTNLSTRFNTVSFKNKPIIGQKIKVSDPKGNYYDAIITAVFEYTINVEYYDEGKKQNNLVEYIIER